MRLINFRTIWSNVRGKRGQVFPFFVLILVVILIASMSYVNVSQVETHKLDTMNAADAGALAGAAVLSQAANNIADINKMMKEAWDANSSGNSYVFAYSGSLLARTYAWYSFAFSQICTYLGACLAAYEAVQSSASAAHATALSAMNIDEAQKRSGSATGPIERSDFSQFMDTREFWTWDRYRNPSNLTYEWYPYQYDFDQKRQVQPNLGNPARAEQVTSFVLKPAENTLELYPMPPMPQVTAFFGILPSVLTCPACPSWDPSGIAMGSPMSSAPMTMWEENYWAYGVGYGLSTAIMAILVYQDMLTDPSLPPGMRNILDNVMQTLFFPMTGWVTPISICITIPTAWGCFSINIYMNVGVYMYFIPVPYIQDLRSGTSEVQVEISRFSPYKNLGLWFSGTHNVTSGARANICCGSVNRDPGGYEIRVGDVWDGARIYSP